MAKRDQELKQLQGWRSTVQSLLERFQELVAQQAAAAQAAAANGTADDAPAAEQAAKADAGAVSAPARLFKAQQAVHGPSFMGVHFDKPASSTSSSPLQLLLQMGSQQLLLRRRGAACMMPMATLTLRPSTLSWQSRRQRHRPASRSPLCRSCASISSGWVLSYSCHQCSPRTHAAPSCGFIVHA